MKTILKNGLLCGLTILTCATSFADDSVEQYRDQVRRGIDLLYKNIEVTKDCVPNVTCADTIDREKLVDQALAFKDRYDTVVRNYQMTDLQMTKKDSRLTEFSFASPIQKPGSKANRVYGYLYQPDMPLACDMKFPATLFIHHVADKISPQQIISSQVVKLYKGVVMLIYLPGYGPRKEDGQKHYFPSDLNDFKEGLFQSLVDIRVATELLKKQSYVDKNKLQLGGMSLGALVTLVVAGLDNTSYKKYFIGLGGGDLARVMGLDEAGRKKTTKNVKDALENIQWNIDESRKALSVLDAMTWAYNVKNKHFTYIVATDDELMNREMSVMKLVEAYKSNSNQIDLFENAGRHVPGKADLGAAKALKTYINVLGKAIEFFGPTRSAEVSNTCGYNN